MNNSRLNYSKENQWFLTGIIFISFVVLIVGLQRDLPYTPDFDEADNLTPSIVMASSGDFNPHRFATPGSLTYYPLAIAFHLWNAITHHGQYLHPDPNLQLTFDRNAWEFYILGRLLSIIYAILSIPLIYLLGKEIFDEQVGIVGALFFSFYSLVVFYSRMVRTDSAALFFVTLSLWLLVKTYKSPTTSKYLLVGLSIGLSIASRYFMAVLIIPLLAIDIALLWQAKSQREKKLLLAQMVIGLSAVGTGFVLSTPYLFVSFDTFLKNIAFESRSTNPGFDGLSPLGNFNWYLFRAVPTILSLPQAFFAVVGMIYIIKTRQFLQITLLGFVFVFIAFVSQFALHWNRWIIQILPILALFTAYGMYQTILTLSKRYSVVRDKKHIITVIIVVLLLVIPVKKVIFLDLKASHYSTRIVALEWIQQNIPYGSHIATEEYYVSLGDADFKIFKSWSLAQSGRTLGELYYSGYRYVVVSESIYARFFEKPERYPVEIAFYQTLFDESELLKEVVPSSMQAGPIIQIYRLSAPKDMLE